MIRRIGVPAAAYGAAAALALLGAGPLQAQGPTGPWPFNFGNDGDQLSPGQRGSPNVQVVSHIPLGGFLHVADIELEQELSRPYVYVSKRFHPTGFDIIDIGDPENAEVIYRWRIENSVLHQGSGALDGKYFKHDGRYYYVQSFQFRQGGPDADLGAIVFDVTGLPDVTEIEEVGRIYAPATPGGFHNIYMYKHSDGTPLLFTTTSGPHTNVYDMARFLDGAEDYGLVARVPVPQSPYWALRGGNASYHDFFVGYFVFDITDIREPELLVSLTNINGVVQGHTFTPSPDGRYAVTETEYQFAPLRLFDLTPAWEDGARTLRQPISAWTADWQNLSHNHEVRWPYVFVSAYEDGLQVFNMMDPYNPYTVAYFDTYDGPHMSRGLGNVNMGAWGVDIRNADGLIVVSDMTTGFWAFRMDGFEGWNGERWGMPNVSSVQDWDNGPAGAGGQPVTLERRSSSIAPRPGGF